MRVLDAVLDVWHMRRRALAVCAITFAMLVGLIGALAVFLHETRHSSASRTTEDAGAGAHRVTTAPSRPQAEATDVPEWDAKPAVVPSASTAYPAVTSDARRDPTAYARAFATELFTRNYATDRQELLAWAQYEDAPLQSSNYPRADWSKVLVDSLTDLTWDDAIDTPVPAAGLWLALRSERATQTVSGLKVSVDSQWEQQVAAGFQPPDPLATVRDVTLTVVQHANTPGAAATTRYQIALALQLGTSSHGGYGVAATNNYVVNKVG